MESYSLPILPMHANWFISNLHFSIKNEVQHVISYMLPNNFVQTIFLNCFNYYYLIAHFTENISSFADNYENRNTYLNDQDFTIFDIKGFMVRMISHSGFQNKTLIINLML